MVEEKRKNKTNKKTFSEKKEKARTVCVQWDKGWMHIIRVHDDTTHLTDAHEEIVKHRNYPPHSYIVNERHNSRNKRATQEKK